MHELMETTSFLASFTADILPQVELASTTSLCSNTNPGKASGLQELKKIEFELLKCEATAVSHFDGENKEIQKERWMTITDITAPVG